MSALQHEVFRMSAVPFASHRSLDNVDESLRFSEFHPAQSKRSAAFPVISPITIDNGGRQAEIADEKLR